MTSSLSDTQNSRDDRDIPIDAVGVRRVRYPVTVGGKNGTQSTTAYFSMYVALPADQKGTHMSRFIDLLEQYGDTFNYTNIQDICTQMLTRLDANCRVLPLCFKNCRQAGENPTEYGYGIDVSVANGRQCRD